MKIFIRHKYLMMKRLAIAFVIMLLFGALSGCASGRKNYHELRGLMLLDNTQLKTNKALYSKHNIKTKKDAYRKYRKNVRYRI